MDEDSRRQLESLFPLVYEELRRLADAHRLRGEPGHMLQTTALVHEAYLKLARLPEGQAWSRNHLVAVASIAMRQVLVNHARDRGRLKRSPAGARMSLDDCAVVDDDRDLVSLDEALKRLAAQDDRKARVVELRFFGGMGVDDIADVLGVGSATIKRDWAMARAWLARELGQGGADGHAPLGQA
ncbi:MAG: ECF-type sigma factor [Phycisphaerales bacterium]